eukprot:1572992-Rhodomonas_salina.2
MPDSIAQGTSGSRGALSQAGEHTWPCIASALPLSDNTCTPPPAPSAPAQSPAHREGAARQPGRAGDRATASQSTPCLRLRPAPPPRQAPLPARLLHARECWCE